MSRTITSWFCRLVLVLLVAAISTRAQAQAPPPDPRPLQEAIIPPQPIPVQQFPGQQFPGQQIPGQPVPGQVPARPVNYDYEMSGPVYQPFNTFVGYDDGFVIANHGEMEVDAAEYPFMTRINSWFHLRHTMFDSDGPNPDQNTVSFERLRLALGGHAYSSDLKYFFQFDGNSDRQTDVIFLDYFITYNISSLCASPGSSLALKMGKWKVPFNRSREESGRRLQFTDRASANTFFDLNRSFGIGLEGKSDCWGQTIDFETAVFNGTRTGRTATSRNGGLDRNLSWSMRAATDFFSPFGRDGEPDLSFHEQLAMRLGGGVFFTRHDAQGAGEFSRLRVVDSGTQLSTILTPMGVTAFDVTYYTVDAHFKYRGFALIAEYYWRRLSDFKGGAVPALNDDGFNLQLGYFIVPHSFEVLTRWSRIVGDSGTLGGAEQSSDEVGGGFVWYINGHNAKVTWDLSHFNGVPESNNRLDIVPGDIGWLMRTQLQLAF